jgi:hypothetical protein
LNVVAIYEITTFAIETDELLTLFICKREYSSKEQDLSIEEADERNHITDGSFDHIGQESCVLKLVKEG